MKYLIHFNVPEIEPFIDRLKTAFPDYFFEIEDRPHLTLMTGKFHESDEEEIVSDLGKLIFNKLDFRFTNYDVFSRGDKGVLVAKLSRSDDSLRLHKEVCDSLRRYIYWESTNKFVNFGDPIEFEQRRKVYQKYGSSAFGDFWAPHLSLGVLETGRGKEVFPRIPGLGGFCFEADKLFLSKKTDSGWLNVREFKPK